MDRHRDKHIDNGTRTVTQGQTHSDTASNTKTKTVTQTERQIKDLHVGAANILKQDALSIGADLAVPHGTVIALSLIHISEPTRRS